MLHRRSLLAILAGLALTTGLTGAPAQAQQKAAKPLKIVVYGGSGNIGSRIVAEAAARGHAVTVVDRNPKAELAPKGVRLVTGDALDAKDIAKNAAGQDAIVSSVVVRPTPTPEFSVNIAKAMVAAQRELPAPKPRLLVVGGAGSLFNAEGKRMVDSLPATLPAGVTNEVRSAALALDWLRTVSDVPWTFFSPAGSITPGQRTGKFRLGTDQIVTDAQGKSAISMEDAAVAIVDELEKPQFIGKRFTVGY